MVKKKMMNISLLNGQTTIPAWENPKRGTIGEADYKSDGVEVYVKETRDGDQYLNIGFHQGAYYVNAYPNKSDNERLKLIYNTSAVKLDNVLREKDFLNNMGKFIYGKAWKTKER